VSGFSRTVAVRLKADTTYWFVCNAVSGFWLAPAVRLVADATKFDLAPWLSTSALRRFPVHAGFGSNSERGSSEAGGAACRTIQCSA